MVTRRSAQRWGSDTPDHPRPQWMGLLAVIGLVALSSPSWPADPEAWGSVLVLSPGVRLREDTANLPSAVVQPLLVSGEMYVDPPIPPFSAAPAALRIEEWEALHRRCAGEGSSLLGEVELLRWSDSSGASDMWERHPEWFELMRLLTCNSREDPNRYASIWHPEAREALLQWADAVARQMPFLDGLIVRYSYSPRVEMGYSIEARRAYILERSIDPIDLGLGSEWVEWRQDAMNDMLADLRRACMDARPGMAVYAWANPGYYRLGNLDRGRACSEWLTWLVDGIVDGVFLEGPWIASATEESQTPPRLYAAALGLLSRMDPLPMFVPTIPTEFAGEEVDIAAQLAQLRSEGPVPALGIVVRKPKHLEAALEALRNFEPDEI